MLAGGKAERLGDAAGGRPKSLVDIAGRPLVAYQIGRLAAAGVERVIMSVAAGQGDAFGARWPGSGPRSSAPRSRSASGVAAGSSSRRRSARRPATCSR